MLVLWAQNPRVSEDRDSVKYLVHKSHAKEETGRVVASKRVSLQCPEKLNLGDREAVGFLCEGQKGMRCLSCSLSSVPGMQLAQVCCLEGGATVGAVALTTGQTRSHPVGDGGQAFSLVKTDQCWQRCESTHHCLGSGLSSKVV